ncbi:hypothetical protein, partial [Sphingobacterium sp. MYb382]|uniref:hypothetical protein n=1 Tax=Sphingobacterium sp. MYb382 TaxID=2745278 RepID=UPI00403FAEA6
MLLLFAFSNSLYGQVRKSFTPRLSVDAGNKTLYNIKGDFTMLGNTNLTLKDYLDNRDNSSNSMIYVDVDRDGSTANSSSADLVFSTENGADASCTEIVYAGLYWTGRVDGKGDSPFNVNTSQLIVNNLNNKAERWTNAAVPYTNANLSIVREGGSFNRSPVYTFTVGAWNLKIRLTNSTTSRAEIDVNGIGYQPLAGNYNTGTGEFVLASPESYVIGNSTIKVVSLRRNTSTSGTNSDYTTVALNYANVELTGEYPQTIASTTSLDKTKVKFKAPGMANYVDIVAKAGDINFPGDNDMYAAYADVTNYVKAGKTGTYFVGNVASLEGDGSTTGYYGGWGIVVVYKNDKMKWRDIAVFDGYAYVVGGIGSNELPISGFQATQEGDVKVKLGVMAGEGDVGITGDYLKIQRKVGNTTSWFDLSHSGNTTTNFFNSSIVTGGNTRNPSLKNNTGMDIAMFDIPNTDKSIIANKATSTILQYGSTQDTYIIFSLVFGVDAYVPEVEPVNGLVSVNGTPVTGTPVVKPGDILEYKVQVKNKGTEAIDNTKLVIPIPYTASFVSAGLTGVVGPGVTGNTTPRYDPLNGALGSIVWDIGTLPLPANPETVLATLTYRLKVTDDCFLLTNPNCTPVVAVNGLVTGIGQTTKATVGTSGEFISGFTGAGNCVGQPLRAPISLVINTAGHCQDYTYKVLDIVFCDAVNNATILAQVRDKFPAGTRFYDNNTGTGQNTEYYEGRPFPTNTPDKVFYALPPGATGCFYEFKIKITSIQNKPTVAAQPVVYCVNEEAVPLTAVATDPSYSLFYYTAIDGQGKPVGNASTTISPNTSTAGTITYYVTQGTALCQSAPSAITVQVLPYPVISTNLQNLTLCAQTNGTLSVSLVTAIPTATYVWQIESGGNWIALNNAAFTANGATLNITNAPLTLNGAKVRVIISNGKCSVTSAVATITVNKLTTITTSPVGAIYCKDVPATALAVVADGTGTLTYQWYSNTSNSTTGGTAISGATSASYTPVTTVVGTQYYYVVVTGSCGTAATSAVAAIMVNKLTTITTSPVGAIYCKDVPATALAVVADGTGTLTYQWYSNTTNSTTGGTAISGATSASYTPVTTVVGTQYYYVVVTGSCGTAATSAVAAIMVNKLTTITTSPVGAIYCKDVPATALAVVADGTGTLTYQWYSNTTNSTTGGTAISGATSASYTPVTTVVGTQYYYV